MSTISRRVSWGTGLFRWAMLLALFLPPSTSSRAQGLLLPESSFKEGWHTVRPGDTLEEITRQYLGTAERWQENWELNKEAVGDANLIYPGQRLRVLLEDELPPGGALLYRKARTVEDQLRPFEWQIAELHDLLRPRDQLRTQRNASAELLFFDDTHLFVTEQSLVIVGEDRRPKPLVDSAQIEIVLGQADLAARSWPADSREIEIVLGDATATPRPAADGAVSTRARRPDAGGAQVMAYRGDSEVAAAGAKITVPQGMGSAVPEDGPPGAPEKLLDPPAGLVPEAGAGLPMPRPDFSWSPVTGARSYTVEICHDPGCGRLVERAVSLEATRWTPSALAIDDYYWRVTAVSTSGLDGYPSHPTRFSILAEVRDSEPPALTVRFTGPRDAPRSGLNEQWILGPGSAIEIEAVDSGGVRQSTALLDGEEATPDQLRAPWERGVHAIAATALDEAGNHASTEAIEFVYDPDPPRFLWGLEGEARFQDVPGFLYVDAEGAAPSLRGRNRQAAGGRDWSLDSDFTQVILRPAGGRARIAHAGEALRAKKGLWILAEDDVCPKVETLAYRLVESSAAGGPALVVEASDCVGNRARIAWPLTEGTF